MNKITSREWLIKALFIFYIISIFLDLHIFYNNISTLIRVIFISIIFLIIFFKYASRVEKKLILSYFLLLFIYLIFHLYHISIFNIDRFVSSNIREILYFIKMSMNILLIFIIYKLEIDKNKYYKLISIASFIITFSIVITNILKISYTSYDFNPILYNIIDWFKYSDISYLVTSSKGYFHLTNQIAAIIILYLPILLINLKNKFNIYNIFNIILSILALFMLGTRVSTYSIFIILIITLIVYLITSFIINKLDKKYGLCLIILLGVSTFIYNYCPLSNRNILYNELFKEEDLSKEDIINDNGEDISKYTNEVFKKYLSNYNINKEFYNTYYPLELDREFYEDYINMNTPKINDTRYLELQIIKRVKDLNNKEMDNYLGIGYDRIMHIFNIESDYTMQYYALGLLGLIIVLGVNVILVIYLGFKMLFNLKRYFNFNNILLLFSITYFLLTTYFTGNILNSISCIIPSSVILGFMLSEFKNKEKKDYEYYLGFKTTLLDKDILLKKIFKEKKNIVIYNINPLIIMNFYKNQKIKNIINKESYNIPDGNGLVLTSILTSNNLRKSIPGIELMESILEESINYNYKVYLYGTKEENLELCKDNLLKKYPKLNIVGRINGYTKEEDVIKDIKNKKPDILFVALGSPLQEEFIIRNKDKLGIKIIMPVGGSFDVFSGNVKRAPQVIRKLKLEWLYRMIIDPKRFKQLFILLKFVILVLFLNFWYNERGE